MKQRISLKLVRRVSIIGAVLSLIVVWYATVRMEIPTFKIGDLSPTNNMAIVRVEGAVTDLRTMPATDSFRLDINDGTGHMIINGYNVLELFRESLMGDFPRAGDKVSVAGNIQLSETRGISMYLTSPGRYQLLERPQPQVATLNKVLASMSNRSFIITVEVAKIRSFPTGYTIEVKDDSGRMNLTMFANEQIQLPEQTAQALLRPGTTFTARVMTSDYKGELQLRLLDPGLVDCVQILSTGQAEIGESDAAAPTQGDAPAPAHPGELGVAADAAPAPETAPDTGSAGGSR